MGGAGSTMDIEMPEKTRRVGVESICEDINNAIKGNFYATADGKVYEALGRIRLGFEVPCLETIHSISVISIRDWDTGLVGQRGLHSILYEKDRKLTPEEIQDLNEKRAKDFDDLKQKRKKLIDLVREGDVVVEVAVKSHLRTPYISSFVIEKVTEEGFYGKDYDDRLKLFPFENFEGAIYRDDSSNVVAEVLSDVVKNRYREAFRREPDLSRGVSQVLKMREEIKL